MKFTVDSVILPIRMSNINLIFSHNKLVKIWGTVKTYKKDKNLQGAKIEYVNENDFIHHTLEVVNDWLHLTGKIDKLKEKVFFILIFRANIITTLKLNILPVPITTTSIIILITLTTLSIIILTMTIETKIYPIQISTQFLNLS